MRRHRLALAYAPALCWLGAQRAPGACGYINARTKHIDALLTRELTRGRVWGNFRIVHARRKRSWRFRKAARMSRRLPDAVSVGPNDGAVRVSDAAPW